MHFIITIIATGGRHDEEENNPRSKKPHHQDDDAPDDNTWQNKKWEGVGHFENIYQGHSCIKETLLQKIFL